MTRDVNYLPLLLLPPPSTPSTIQVPLPSTLLAVATSTAQMLSRIVSTTVHRRAASVTDWLPQVERQPEVKSRRGWEKTSALSSNTTSPWVAWQLVALLGDSEEGRDSKVGPIAQLVIECLLTLISWWML